MSEGAFTRIVERRGGAEIVLRKIPAPRGAPSIARDGGRASGLGRGVAGFWNKVAKQGESPGGCWLWTGYLDPDGYGKFCSTLLRPDRKSASRRPHRLTWEWENGRTVPAGMVLMHLCDVPACVNPAHLRPATQGENVRDCYAKGRHENQADNRGELCGRATLRDEDVLFIRAQERVYGLVPVLARIYGVKQQVIRNALDRKTWRHIGRGNITNRMALKQLRELADQRERDRGDSLDYRAVARTGTQDAA